MGALEVLAQPYVWQPGTEALIEQIDLLQKVLAGDVVDCSSVTVPFSCDENLAVSDHGWDVYSIYGAYSAGNGWQTSQYVEGGETKFSLIAGPTYGATQLITRVEVTIDFVDMGTGSDFVGLFTQTGTDSFASLGPNLTPLSGINTYIWTFDPAVTESNLRINPGGHGAGLAQVTRFKVFGLEPNNISGFCD